MARRVPEDKTSRLEGVELIADEALFGAILIVLAGHYANLLTGSLATWLLAGLSILGTLPVVISAVRSIAAKKISVDLLASVALVFSLIAAEWASALFINLMLTSARIFWSYSDRRARRNLASLMKLKPELARVRRGDGVQEIPLSEVKKGDLVQVELGERIPVDGTVVEGESENDQSALTGESLPVRKVPGDPVLSASVVVSGNLVIRADRVGRETMLEKIIELVESSQENKAEIHTLAEKFASWYLWTIFAGSIVLYLIGHNVSLVLSVLLVVCADDIAVATPLAFVTAVGFEAKRGVIVKGSNFLEGMQGVKTIVVDKTGTLTRGQLSVERVQAFRGASLTDVFAAASALAERSDHPVSRAILHEATVRGVGRRGVDGYQESSGKGSYGVMDGEPVTLGRLEFLRERGVTLSPQEAQEVERVEGEGYSVSLVSRGASPLGFIALADAIRPEVVQAVKELRGLGVERIVMLTGDNERIAERIAKRVGVTEYHANLLPEDKLTHLKRYLNPKDTVVMVGDGVNDAAALSLADIGIAMGGVGYDVAIESADIVLMKDNFEKVPELVRTARYLMSIIHENFMVWGITNLAGLALVFFGVLGPTGAAAYNFLTDFFPLMNSARVLMLYRTARRG